MEKDVEMPLNSVSALRAVGVLGDAAIVTVQLEDSYLIVEKDPAFAVLSATPLTGLSFPNVKLSQAGSFTVPTT